jgi:hypothetical protein
MRPWQHRLYRRMISAFLRVERQGAPSKPDAGWGDLTAEDLRRQGITPGMAPPGKEAPRAVVVPRGSQRHQR